MVKLIAQVTCINRKGGKNCAACFIFLSIFNMHCVSCLAPTL